MRQYDVYGLGNALVDIQFQVDPSFFEAMEIDKGVMTLIDGDRQRALIDALGGKEMARSSGGSAANTMIALANCGGRGYYGCKVAEDADGAFYLRDLNTAGVACNLSHRGEGVTGKCLVMITEDADRTMNTFLGITSTFGVAQVEDAVIADSQYIYIEGYLVAADDGFEAAQAAQKVAQAHGTKVALTLSDPSIVAAFKDRMTALVDAGVDMLFCNEDEGRIFTDAEATEEAFDALRQRVGGLALTYGAEGARICDGGDVVHAPGFEVDAVDTNGAGDSFAGAYLFAVTRGYDAAQAARLATYVSSRVVAKYGPRFERKMSGAAINRILKMR
ncbi:MAG: adenosine kinase [Gemmatimonadetes bacterium]|nr:adenosine kinase [Gemmatimonadota bacterium]